MGKPQVQPDDAEYDRLREEIESLQREMESDAGGGFDPVTQEIRVYPR
ncbi:MAG: hypothetical protein LM522_07485 [Candidatus Contendobacter sp.]|nr:hypothetical protein [Candidatus Contendobacter sp.]